MSESGLDDRALRDALEQTQAEARRLVALEQRGFDLDAVRSATEAEVGALEARNQQLLAEEVAAIRARDASADALVHAMEGSDFKVAMLSQRERWWLMFFDGGQFVGTAAGFLAGMLVAASGLPTLLLAVAAPALVLLTTRRRAARRRGLREPRSATADRR